MIMKTTRKMPVGGKAPVTAGTNITSGVRSRNASPILASTANLTPEQRAFARQIQNNIRRKSAVMGATNTSNIMARPDFLELLPMFVQKLIILDVFGSVAMRSRQQLVPYFKFVAENTKGETKAGDILSSPFVNRQGVDPNFTGRIIKNEIVSEGNAIKLDATLMYTPVLPSTITFQYTAGGTTAVFVDDGTGKLIDAADDTKCVGYIDYSTGAVQFDDASAITPAAGSVIKATYQYDNENVGARAHDNGQFGYEYGAQMGKGSLQLDEFNLVAEAHELACYWSIFSAFAAQQEYGANIGDIAKEAAFSELTAEINTKGFQALLKAASYKPQFNWDASPVLSGSVVPSDYLNMFKLKLSQAAASIYQATRLSQPNRLAVGSNVAAYLSMVQGFQAEGTTDNVGPYKLGKLDQFDIYVDPNFNPDTWVMSCKSNDIRRNSALFGEYMPLTESTPVGLANSSVQQGYATMYAMKVVNPDTVVSGKILGTM
jgi:hypothetical protein